MGEAQIHITSSKREQIGFIRAELFSLFLLVLKVIFFSGAKSDISLTGSDIARQSLAVIFYSPKNSRSEYHSAQAEYNCVAISLAVGE